MAGDPPNNPPEEGRGSGTASRPPPSETTSNTHSSLPLSSLPGSVPNDGAPAQSEQARSSSEGPLESPTGREKLPNSPVLRRNLPRSSQRKRKPVDQPAEEAQEFPTEVPTEVQKEAQTEETNSSREEEQAGQEVALTCKDGEDGGSTSSEEGGRKRRKLNDTGESATGSTKSSAAPKKKSRMSATGTPRSDKRWEAPFVYTDERSPLVNGNLRDILLLPEAWDVLTAEEKEEILALFPEGTPILDEGTEGARPDTEALLNNDHFNYDCARYIEHIKDGRHDEEWLRQAWEAHERHKRGDFDKYLRDMFEIDWGVEPPQEGSDNSQGSSSDKDANEEAGSSSGSRKGSEEKKASTQPTEEIPGRNDADVPLRSRVGKDPVSSSSWQPTEEETDGVTSGEATNGKASASPAPKGTSRKIISIAQTTPSVAATADAA